MEISLPIEPATTLDGYRDLLTHHYAPSVFYDALKREVSFAKREGQHVAVVKFQLPKRTTLDQLLFFSNELEMAVRHHDLISRIAEDEFAVLLRFDFDTSGACECLVSRVAKMEKREFYFAWASSDGTKGVDELLEELDNPQIFRSSKSL